MSGAESKRDPVEQLAEDFLARVRRGENPSVSEYALRHPLLADSIRELFPVLIKLEGAYRDASGASPADELAEPSAAGIPDRFGDYRIIREIGRGGMGLVYEAEQETLGRRVALKVLPLHASMASVAVERFRREAQAAARLHHTNIVPVFDVGQEGPTCFYAMQYIDGSPLDEIISQLRQFGPSKIRTSQLTSIPTDLRSLAESLRCSIDGNRESATVVRDQVDPPTDLQGSSVSTEPHVLTASEVGDGGPPVMPSDAPRPTISNTGLDGRPYYEIVARLGRQVADALAYAHGKGVIHRDIKPSNLLLDQSGVAWVTDFGMVKVDGETLTHSGDILGTLRYMAPERFQGACDARADIYALGLTLYELLILQPAFNAPDRLQLIEMIHAKAPRPPRQYSRKIPRDLETIVLKAMDKHPDRRYQSAEAMSDDLQRFLDDRPILARPISTSERLLRWARRNPVVSGLSAALVAILLTVAVVATIAAYRFQFIATSERIASRRAMAAEKQATINLENAEESARQADQRAEQLRRQDYVNRVNLAYLESRYDNVARAMELLDGCAQDLRGWEWTFVRSQNEVALNSWPVTGTSVNAVAFHPDQPRLAIGTGNFANRRGGFGSLLVRNVETGAVEFSQNQLTDGVNAVAFSPDGTRLASANGGQLRVWDLRSGRKLYEITRSPAIVALAFSPDGNTLAAGYGVLNSSDAGYTVLYDPANGTELHDPLPGHPGGVWALAFHPNGSQLATSSEGLVEIWDLQSHRPVRQLTDESGFLYAVAWHPTGQYIAAGGLNRTIRMWDVASGKSVRSFAGHTGIVRSLAFGPEGERLVSASEDKTIRLWRLESEREEAVFRGHTHFVNSVCFSHDGNLLSSGSLDQTVKLWFAAPDHQLVYKGHARQGHVRNLAFSPQGDAIATGAFYFAGENDRIHVWDPHTGKSLAQFPHNLGDVTAIAFNHDGSRIASGHPSGELRIWDARRGRLIAQLEGHVGAVWDVKYSSDGTLLASCGQDGAVNLWDVATGSLLRSIFSHLENVRAIEISPDGSQIVSAGDDGTVKLWNAQTGTLIRAFSVHEGAVWGLAFSPDGKSIAAVGGIDRRQGDVRVWDATDGRLMHRLQGHTDIVFDAAFSPDGKRLATASDDRTIKLWDTQTGDEVFTLRGHSGGVLCVAFSPNGQQIASGGVDRTAHVWSTENPDATVRYQRHWAAHVEQAEAQMAAGRWTRAVEILDRALQHGFDGPGVRAKRLLAAAQAQGEPSHDETSLDVEKTFVSIDDPYSLLRLAAELARVGRPEVALAAVGRATELEPNNARAWAAAGRLHAAQGHGAQAKAAFQRASDADLRSTSTAGDIANAWFETGWWVTGPFPEEFTASFAPEYSPGPFQPDADGQPATTDASHRPPWVSIEPDGDGYVNLRNLLGGNMATSAYTIEQVYSPVEQTAALLLGSDGPMRVWLDDQVVYERLRKRTARDGDDVIPVALKPGWNRLLTRVGGDGQRLGMYVRFSRRAADLARSHLAQGNLADVITVWQNATELDRREPRLLAFAGEALARSGQWQEAASVFRQLVERQPVRNRNWAMLAPLLVQAGETQAYREHRAMMLASFAQASLPITLERTAKACLLLPDEPADLAAAAQMAANAAVIGANHSFVAYFRLADGMGQFRIGNHLDSCTSLQSALKLNDGRDPYIDTAALYFLAMACHQRQLAGEARQFLDQANGAFEQRLPVRDGDLGAAWPDWLVCDIARREATAMLGSQ
jgi:WD40 repeat protein/serine/threonine protein kinase/tetratricopeptide (TPR) repeat protein